MATIDNPFLLNQELYIGNSSVNLFANSITLKFSEGLTLLDRLTGSNIGNMTENGGLAAAFDGDSNATFYTASVKSNTASAYVGKTLAAPSAIVKAVIYSPQLVGYSSSSELTAKLYVKSGSAPANSVDGTLLAALDIVDSDNTNLQEIVSNNQIDLWDHVWVTTEPSESPADMHIGEVAFYGYPGTSVVINSTCLVIGNSSVNTGISAPNTIAYSGDYFLHANGSWTEVVATGGGNATPGGSNTSIQFNDSNTLGGSAGLTFDKVTNNFVVANTITVGNSSANLILSSVDIRVGNTTVNGLANSIFISLANSTSTANLSPIDLTIGNTIINSTMLQVTGTVNAVATYSNSFSGVPFVSASNGYCYLFNGMIFQWGHVDANSSAGNITLPITFPNALYSYVVTSTGAYDVTYLSMVIASNTSTMNVRTANATSRTVQWIAIGN